MVNVERNMAIVEYEHEENKRMRDEKIGLGLSQQGRKQRSRFGLSGFALQDVQDIVLKTESRLMAKIKSLNTSVTNIKATMSKNENIDSNSSNQDLNINQ